MPMKGNLMSRPNLSVTDCVYLCMRNGRYWTFWELQTAIKDKTGSFYGEPTISAGIRNLRKYEYRNKYGLPMLGDTITKRRIQRKIFGHHGKGYEYKLVEHIRGDNYGQAI